MSRAEQALVGEFRSIVHRASRVKTATITDLRQRSNRTQVRFDSEGVTTPLQLDIFRRRALQVARIALIPGSRNTLIRSYRDRYLNMDIIATERVLSSVDELDLAVRYVRSPHLESEALEKLCVILPDEKALRENLQADSQERFNRRIAEVELAKSSRLAARAAMTPEQLQVTDWAEAWNAARPFM